MASMGRMGGAPVMVMNQKVRRQRAFALALSSRIRDCGGVELPRWWAALWPVVV